jgi:pimeloyl-ACP methyl ester carboxylesterase
LATLLVRSRRIAYLDRGEGAPVVLVHASGLGAAQWGAIAPRLAARHRVLAMDLLGCGETDAWPDADRFDIDEDLAIVQAVAEQAAAPAHVVGHSYGGALALRLASRAPSLVRSLTVFEPVAFGVLEAHDPEGAASLNAAMHPAFLDPLTGGSPAWVERFIDFWNGPGAWGRMGPGRKAALAATGRKSWLEVCGLLRNPDRSFDIRCPTLLLQGTRSPRAAEGVCRVLEGMIPGARRIVLDGAGHMAPVEEPKRFLALVAEHLAAT